jgi:iron complex outermembrane receptor protein
MINASSRVLFQAIVSAASLIAIATTAVAQQTTVLEEIVVTSQKREQAFQDVPLSVSVISGDLVHDYLGSAENLRALTNRVPSLRSLPLFDIERVEVLRGPQGTLFGRNTNAGMIKIDSVQPTFETEGYASVAYGDRNTAALETAIGGELSNGVAARLSLKYQRRDNWIDNTANGPGDDFGKFSEFAYRFQLLFQPGDVFRGLVKLHGFHQDGSHPQVFYGNAFEQGQAGLRQGFDEEIAGQDPTLFTDVGDFPQPLGMSLDHIGGAINLQWDWGDRKFTSITGYDTVENFQSGDIDGSVVTFPPSVPGTPNEVLFAQISTGDGLEEHYQFTQEFRFSNQGDRLFYQVGVFYFEEDIDVRSEDFAGFQRGFCWVPPQPDPTPHPNRDSLDRRHQSADRVGSRFRPGRIRA